MFEPIRQWCAVTVAPFKAFIAFAAIGAVAFIIDAFVLTLILSLEPEAFYTGRLISFMVCVTFTFYFNSILTFADGSGSPRSPKFLKYILANSLGGGVNLGVYGLLIAYFAIAREWPIFAAGAGSVAGLFVNFSVAKFYVFRTTGQVQRPR